MFGQPFLRLLCTVLILLLTVQSYTYLRGNVIEFQPVMLSFQADFKQYGDESKATNSLPLIFL